MPSLNLNQSVIDRCRAIADEVSRPVEKMIQEHTSISIERATLRLLGVDGAIAQAGLMFPKVNIITDALKKKNALQRGVLFWFSNAMIQKNMTLQQVADGVCDGSLQIVDVPLVPLEKIKEKALELSKQACERIDQGKKIRNEIRGKTGDIFSRPMKTPAKYVIVATGNIYEDVIQAEAAAQAGADIIAVIRSTAQSLLDYVPHGATTEGYGGTYATQENFKIMRTALDKKSEQLGRYIRLTNYCSGLCMAEIATMGSLERLDCLLNDAMYGILFRDINMKRTLLDQHFSRRILSRSEIMIQTGEDNYLTTADAVENGHQVLASQFINERFAMNASIISEQMGLGHAQEMDPEYPDVFLLEIARAQMTRDIFPKSPIKFMPPTRFKCGDIFYSHLMDAMFNFVGVLTRQGVQLLGMPTEAMHTPLLQDRWMSLKNAQYIFNGAQSLADDIIYKPDGKINKWAEKVLNDTLSHLEMIQKKGLFKAIEEKAFANVSRKDTGGKGLDGVFERAPDYVNPFFKVL